MGRPSVGWAWPWGAALLVLCSLAGCERAVGHEGEEGCCGEETWIYPQADERDVDLLFVVDNSGSMEGEQALLSSGFGSLMAALAELPGGMPNVHIGVTSTDLGSGSAGVTYCETPGGDGGRLLTGTCEVPTGVPYIVDVEPVGCEIGMNDWGVCHGHLCSAEHCLHEPSTTLVEDWRTGCPRCRNFGEEQLSDVFGCIADLGTTGCSFEQPLEAMVKALNPENPANAGFLRPGSVLGVVIVTDEDDCSVADERIFDDTSTHLNSSLGPFTSFRCFEHGITCDVDQRTHTGVRRECVPREDGGSLLEPVGRYVSLLQELRTRRPVMLAAIAGPVAPSGGGEGYNVEVGLDEQQYPRVVPSCKNSTDPWDGATPGVRLHRVIAALSTETELATWAYTPVCAGNYRAPLEGLGSRIVRMLEYQCLPGRIAGCADPGVEYGAPHMEQHCAINSRCLPECRVKDVLAHGLPQEERVIVPPCLEVGPDGVSLDGNTVISRAYEEGRPDERDPDLPVRACWYVRYQWACGGAAGAQIVIARPEDPPLKTVAEVTCRLIPEYERVCDDHVDDDQNCLVDGADPCCLYPSSCGD